MKFFAPSMDFWGVQEDSLESAEVQTMNELSLE